MNLMQYFIRRRRAANTWPRFVAPMAFDVRSIIMPMRRSSRGNCTIAQPATWNLAYGRNRLSRHSQAVDDVFRTMWLLSTRKMEQVQWDLKTLWGWAVTKPLGHGFINWVGDDPAPIEIDFEGSGRYCTWRGIAYNEDYTVGISIHWCSSPYSKMISLKKSHVRSTHRLYH